MMQENNYMVPENFINRELSWLEFNKRVLQEAYDKTNPLFERLRFISIFSSNLDEFFMIRVASLRDQIEAGFHKKDPSGWTPENQIKEITEKSQELVKMQYDYYKRNLLCDLEKEKITFLKKEQLNESQMQYILDYYKKNIYPVLTPMVVEQGRYFPLILNKSLNIALILENIKEKKQSLFATVQVPSVLERFIEIPSKDNKKYFILLEEIIKMFIQSLFIGHKIMRMGCYRITRNADLSLEEEGAEDLLESIEESLKKRKWGAVVRLEVEDRIEEDLVLFLKKELEIVEEKIYFINGPLDLTFLMKFSELRNYDFLRYTTVKPKIHLGFTKCKDIFQAISQRDILLHHPYESFEPVISFIKQAAKDPQVLAIKQTLYRVSGNSPIIEALEEAARNGKQVTTLVELKARFDELNNIHWARRLERAGCHVIYGLIGLKTHCKLLLVVRREERHVKRYLHMGTGNYNDVTAKYYTDIGLFTTNPLFVDDVSALFNMLSGYSNIRKMNKIDIAPTYLRTKFISLIKREIKNAIKGKKGYIVAKMNSLVDEEIIKNLYIASNAGVKINLIVRGICCLRPGIIGVSENISVTSIVGRFLEHSRIFYFYNDGEEEIYLSSADWMHRNLNRRVEILFPLEDRKVKKKAKEILDIYLKDTVKARLLTKDGAYKKIKEEGYFNSQEFFIKSQ